jgi:uncharacterized protein YceK
VFVVVVSTGCVLSGCGSILSQYAADHPDVLAKATAAIELSQCVDDAVTKYRKAEAAATSTAVAAPITAVDAGPPPVPASAADGGAP